MRVIKLSAAFFGGRGGLLLTEKANGLLGVGKERIKIIIRAAGGGFFQLNMEQFVFGYGKQTHHRGRRRRRQLAAGAIGAGGIGDFAIRYGYQMGYRDMIWLTVLIILAIISIFQFFGNMIIRRTTH